MDIILWVIFAILLMIVVVLFFAVVFDDDIGVDKIIGDIKKHRNKKKGD